MSSDKSGSPPCGIYIRIDDFSDMPSVITAIRQVALVINRTSGYEKNMCVIELVFSPDNDGVMERISDLIPLIKEQGFVSVISGEGSFYNDTMGADGVLLDSADDVSPARSKLGEDAIIGLKCAGDHNLAQKAVLLEVDYVELNADQAMISWFKSISASLMICANDQGVNAENCSVLAHAGADLVNASDYILKHKKGAMQGAVNIQHSLEVAAQCQGSFN